MQMGLTAVLVNTLHPALEDAELALGSVAVNLAILKIHVLTAAVVGRAVIREVILDRAIAAVFIGHDASFRRAFRANDRHQRGGRCRSRSCERDPFKGPPRQHLHVVVGSTAASFGYSFGP